MTLNDFITDYPEIFDECIDDIDWHKVFKWIDDGDLDDLADYLKDHFDAFQQGLMPQDGPDPDEQYDRKRQERADFGGICPKPDLSFLDIVYITNMKGDK